MNQDIMRAMGYSNEVEMKNNGLCPMCGIHVGKIPFTDEMSKREYRISGLCQNCQNAVFKSRRS